MNALWWAVAVIIGLALSFVLTGLLRKMKTL